MHCANPQCILLGYAVDYLSILGFFFNNYNYNYNRMNEEKRKPCISFSNSGDRYSQLPGHGDVQTKETGSAKILMDIMTQQINFSFTWKV